VVCKNESNKGSAKEIECPPFGVEEYLKTNYLYLHY